MNVRYSNMPRKGLHVFRRQRRQRKNRERERGGRSNDGTQLKQDMFLASSVGPYQHTGIGHLFAYNRGSGRRMRNIGLSLNPTGEPAGKTLSVLKHSG